MMIDPTYAMPSTTTFVVNTPSARRWRVEVAVVEAMGDGGRRSPLSLILGWYFWRARVFRGIAEAPRQRHSSPPSIGTVATVEGSNPLSARSGAPLLNRGILLMP